MSEPENNALETARTADPAAQALAALDSEDIEVRLDEAQRLVLGTMSDDQVKLMFSVAGAAMDRCRSAWRDAMRRVSDDAAARVRSAEERAGRQLEAARAEADERVRRSEDAAEEKLKKLRRAKRIWQVLFILMLVAFYGLYGTVR